MGRMREYDLFELVLHLHHLPLQRGALVLLKLEVSCEVSQLNIVDGLHQNEGRAFDDYGANEVARQLPIDRFKVSCGGGGNIGLLQLSPQLGDIALHYTSQGKKGR